MADTAKLETPRLHVVMDDGAVHDVQVWNKDLLAWDRTRIRRKWPTAQDVPIQWMTFIAWSALMREGQIPSMTLDEFEDAAIEVRKLDDDDDEDDGVGPTRTGPEPV